VSRKTIARHIMLAGAAGVLGRGLAARRDRRLEGENARLQAELHQAQKLESVGRLAGGIAHDFNNLLAVILNSAEFATQELDDRAALIEDLDAINSAGQRAAELTRQLLIFSRREPAATEPLDLNAVVAGTARLIRRTLPEDIDTRIRLAGEPLTLLADRGQLEHVVLNLTLNARDALEGPGSIAIETRRATVRESEPGRGEPAPGPYALVAVSDTGRGMSRDVVEKAFEPFYTTKPPGSGTGLGLATVYGIVRHAGGHVHIESEPGAGTRVKVYLPLAGDSSGIPGPAPLETPPERGDGEVVLVVEDQEDVRRVTARALRTNGYSVLEAAGPKEARRRWRRIGGRVDLLLTDIVMPDASGHELARELRAQAEELKVVYMSGYADDFLIERGAAGNDGPLLQKPFTRDVLLEAVRSALDGSRLASSATRP
jgi:two-component system cell cycle sensor histidine kinase/response regulator CckA